jgi:hypothetical protein
VKERSDVLARPRDFLDFNTLTLTRTLPARYISPTNRAHARRRSATNEHTFCSKSRIGDGFPACEILFALLPVLLLALLLLKPRRLLHTDESFICGINIRPNNNNKKHKQVPTQFCLNSDHKLLSLFGTDVPKQKPRTFSFT